MRHDSRIQRLIRFRSTARLKVRLGTLMSTWVLESETDSRGKIRTKKGKDLTTVPD